MQNNSEQPEPDLSSAPRARPLSTHANKFMVRFPGQMRQQIFALATQNHRSMNSEIVARLEESLSREELLQEQTEEPELTTDAKVFKRELTPFEVRLVIFFRRLSRVKKKALLELFS